MYDLSLHSDHMFRTCACQLPVGVQQRISEQDSLVLKHLVDIVGSHFCPADGCGSHGFVLKFLFSPNKYFSEDHLSIKVMFADEDEAIVRSIEGTSISWTSHSVFHSCRFCPAY